MASENRHRPDSLGTVEALLKDAPRWSFYAALREMECLHSQQPRLGKARRPVDDKLRLGQEPSSIFAPSTIHSGQQDGQGLLQMKVLFFGMFGPNGPLPLHLTEYARNRVRDARDESMVHFMDMFHHRLLSLFYRVWADKEPTVEYDRPDSDKFHRYVGSLCGIGTAGHWNRDGVADNSKLHFSAHLASLPHHAEGLASILKSFFKVPLEIAEFIGEWLVIPEESRCKLGMEGAALGRDTVIGASSWQRQYRFRLQIGPMSLDEYESLLPGGEKLSLVADVLKNYLGYELTCDAKLILKKEEVPMAQLGTYGQLGWTSWLKNTPTRKDAGDLLLEIRG